MTEPPVLSPAQDAEITAAIAAVILARLRREGLPTGDPGTRYARSQEETPLRPALRPDWHVRHRRPSARVLRRAAAIGWAVVAVNRPWRAVGGQAATEGA
jgi:hypothetical protein